MIKTNKKTLLVTMLVVLFATMLLVGGLSLNTSTQVNNQVKAETSTTLLGGRYNSAWYSKISYKYDITNLLVTTDDSKKPDTYLEAPDVSEAQDGSLHAYIINGTEANTYDCIIYGDVDVIYAPEDSSTLFCGDESFGGHAMTRLYYTKSIIFENFDTSKTTNMSMMFGNIDVIELDLRLFDTSKVTNMESMFEYCFQLQILDISSFVINSDVQTYNFFYFNNNKSPLEFIYAPKQCDVSFSIGDDSYSKMYYEGTDTEVTQISSETNGKILCSQPNTYAPVREPLNPSIPSTGFDLNDIVIVTTLGTVLLTVMAVAFVGTKKRYVNR